MNYELRTLCSKDIFPLSKIISCIGIKEFRTCFESDAIMNAAKNAAKKGKGGKEQEYMEVGIGVFLDIAGIILGNLPKCENEIFDFLASVSNLSRKDVEEMELSGFAQMVMDVIQKPEFRDFIGVVLKSFK